MYAYTIVIEFIGKIMSFLPLSPPPPPPPPPHVSLSLPPPPSLPSQVQSSNPVIIKLPTTKTRSSKAVSSGRGIISSLPSTAATATASGSDYHCPECGLRDDGSPMIGCDGCDSWVHWTCVGITREPPDDEKWFCPTCLKSRQSGKKKKGRKRKRTH